MKCYGLSADQGYGKAQVGYEFMIEHERDIGQCDLSASSAGEYSNQGLCQSVCSYAGAENEVCSGNDNKL